MSVACAVAQDGLSGLVGFIAPILEKLLCMSSKDHNYTNRSLACTFSRTPVETTRSKVIYIVKIFIYLTLKDMLSPICLHA